MVNEKLKHEIYALISIIIAVLGQVAMKWGMADFANIDSFSYNILTKVLLDGYVLIGFICYITAMFLWLKALKGLPLSYAFPLQSIGTVMIFLFSWLLLKEDISLTRWIGFFFLMTGLIFLTKK